MKLYCQQCFAKIEYKFLKPKFCTECGKQMTSVASTSSSVNIIKNNSEQRIKDLELQLEELKNNKQIIPNKNTLRKANYNIVAEEQDYEGEEYEDEEVNSIETQKIVNAFKRGRIKSGVTVEKNKNNEGISFKDLMDGVSSGAISVGNDDFKMENDTRKTDKQILEEFKIEASSKSRVIQID